MADEKSIAVIKPDPVKDVDSDEGRAIAEKNELRKNLNAYAIMAYVAVSDRNAMAEQLKGLDHLNQAIMELQDKLKRAQDRSEDLQLEIWRNEAFVTRSRLQLRIKDNEIRTLKDEIKIMKSTSEPTAPQGDDVKNSDSGDSGKGSEESDSTKGGAINEGGAEEESVEKKVGGKGSTKPSSSGETDYLMSRGLQIGVSREVHEAVVQENLHLKNTLKQALDKQGASLTDLIDTIQYKEIVKQLKKKIAAKDEEIAKIKDAIRQAESPKEKTAQILLDMEAKLKNAERTIKMKEVMMEALSSRCEELSKALEQTEERQEIRAAYTRSTFTDSKTTADALAKVAVDQVLPSVEIKKLTKENGRMKKLQEHQTKENEMLRELLQKSETERNEFQRKLTSISKLALEPCATCKDYKDQNERVMRDLADTKDSLSAALYQADTYKTDFREKCKEVEQAKATADMWHQNFGKLNQQMEKMRNELDKQRTLNSQLDAVNKTLHQENFQRTHIGAEYGQLASMPAAMTTSQQCRFNPWQESTDSWRVRSEVAVGRDQCDLASPEDDTDAGRSHQWTAARPSNSRRRQRKLQCMHCHREFSTDRQLEFEDHQRNCPNNP